MNLYPPFQLQRSVLNWLAYMIEQYRDKYAMNMLWWQASIGPLGINQTSAIRARGTP